MYTHARAHALCVRGMRAPPFLYTLSHAHDPPPHQRSRARTPGHKLQNDKTVPFKDNDFIPFEFLMSYHFVGDFIRMEVLRKETDAVRAGSFVG